MVRDPDGPELLPWAVGILARPDGAHAVLVGAAGPTAALARARRLVVLGPLGRGFDLAGLDGATTVVLAQGHAVATVAGVAAALGPSLRTVVAVDAGGEAVAATLLAGRVSSVAPDTQAARLDALLDAGDVRHVLAAGPHAVVAAVAARCRAADVPCQVALEAPMACGFGACHGCVVRLDGSWRRLCLEGPVVDARRLAAS
jgi:NAD(P)H-flavin reductase